ncbi:MAG: 1-deoxy-D-xylulose-5-phosphate reductoisomerase [Planctomycetota bacterium]
MPRRVAILGSTGSIGTQTLDAIDHLNQSGFDFDVVAMTAGRNKDLLHEQAQRWPEAVTAVSSEDGPEALVDFAARDDVDIVVHAIVGAAGLEASFAAAETGKRLCLANKESLVVAGTLLMDRVRKAGGEIVPIDSEHTAIFQAMACGRREDVRRIILTASGGPFREASAWPAGRLQNASVEEALAHPTWTMGGKITVDSATLFNKGFELIEAVHLYAMDEADVEVVVHPQSLVHSMVEFADGSTIAHVSAVDMRLPIAYALTHPERGRDVCGRMNWRQATRLDFEPPDESRFGALGLCRQAVRRGGVVPAWLNAANEVAVERFLSGELSFGGITETVARCVKLAPADQPTSLSDLLATDAAAREATSVILREQSQSKDLA